MHRKGHWQTRLAAQLDSCLCQHPMSTVQQWNYELRWPVEVQLCKTDWEMKNNYYLAFRFIFQSGNESLFGKLFLLIALLSKVNRKLDAS